MSSQGLSESAGNPPKVSVQPRAEQAEFLTAPTDGVKAGCQPVDEMRDAKHGPAPVRGHTTSPGETFNEYKTRCGAGTVGIARTMAAREPTRWLGKSHDDMAAASGMTVPLVHPSERLAPVPWMFDRCNLQLLVSGYQYGQLE